LELTNSEKIEEIFTLSSDPLIIWKRSELHQLLVVIQMEATCFQMSHALVVEEEDRMVVVKAMMSWLASVESSGTISCVPCLERDVCGFRPHEQAWLTPRRNGVVEHRKGGPAFSAE
jgi:hypothetical protein